MEQLKLIKDEEATLEEELQKIDTATYNQYTIIRAINQIYEKTCDKKLLLGWADKMLDKGELCVAGQVYEFAGENITKNKQGLLNCGNIFIKKGWTKDAKFVFEKIDYKEGLIQCGARFVEENDFYSAIDAYVQAKYTRGLIDCGIKALKKAELYWAEKAFDKAGEDMKPYLIDLLRTATWK